jgi:hypothetical protein
MEDAMRKLVPFGLRLAAAARHFLGLVIVPVLAVMLGFPANAQQIISDPEAQSTGPAVAQSADPTIRISIDKSRQKMTVAVDGVEKYEWPVSTGKAGYSTPTGTYTATSMNEVWYSKEWDNAPMPHSIFFMKDGHAIHGSLEVRTLGKAVSHGCVRISPENAKTLFALVKQAGLKNTEVVLAGVTPGGEYKVARSRGSYEYDDGYYAQPQWRGYQPQWGGYYAQPQWRDDYSGRSYGRPSYYGSQGYYRQPPPRGFW